MQKFHLTILLLVLLPFGLRAQNEVSAADFKFPLIVTLQFHGFAIPFKDLSSNLRNTGIGIGTEVKLNTSNTWVQQVHAVWYKNKAVGNGLLFYSQNVWRPTIESSFAELKMGAGYLYSFRPSRSYKNSNGEWKDVGKRGKGMLALPVGISIGTYKPLKSTSIAPFITYQAMLINGYNTSIPIVPQTLLQTGVLIAEE